MPATLESPSAVADTSQTELRSLRGRIVLITGGGRGLGGAIAQVLGEAGARLVLADIVLERAQDCAAVLGDRDIEATALALDVTDPDQCARAVESVRQRFGRLDALINNAGIDIPASMAELSVPDWDRLLNTNLSGPFLMAKQAAAVMAKQEGGGHIVNIACTASKRAWPNASAYHATKCGLLGLSHALHAELRPHGIKVCAVVAGSMHTELAERPTHAADTDNHRLQDPVQVARVVRFVLQQPEETTIPEVTVLPVHETAWP